MKDLDQILDWVDDIELLLDDIKKTIHAIQREEGA